MTDSIDKLSQVFGQKLDVTYVSKQQFEAVKKVRTWQHASYILSRGRIGDIDTFTGDITNEICRAISHLNDIGLKVIDGDVDFSNTGIKTLPKLERITGVAYFSGSSIKELENLEFIGANAKFSGTENLNLPKLKTIMGKTDCRNAINLGLPALEIVDGDLLFTKAGASSLPSLIYAKSIEATNSKLKDLPQLVSIGSHANFSFSPIKGLKDLPKLKFCGIQGVIFDSGKVGFND